MFEVLQTEGQTTVIVADSYSVCSIHLAGLLYLHTHQPGEFILGCHPGCSAAPAARCRRRQGVYPVLMQMTGPSCSHSVVPA